MNTSSYEHVKNKEKQSADVPVILVEIFLTALLSIAGTVIYDICWVIITYERKEAFTNGQT